MSISVAFRTTRRGVIDQDAFSAAMLYHMVKPRVAGLTDAEYAAGLEYAARKHRLPRRGGRLDLSGMSVGWLAYIADLVAEAIGQDRLSRGTMEIARSDRELEESEKQKGNETA